MNEEGVNSRKKLILKDHHKYCPKICLEYVALQDQVYTKADFFNILDQSGMFWYWVRFADVTIDESTTRKLLFDYAVFGDFESGIKVRILLPNALELERLVVQTILTCQWNIFFFKAGLEL